MPRLLLTSPFDASKLLRGILTLAALLAVTSTSAELVDVFQASPGAPLVYARIDESMLGAEITIDALQSRFL